MVKAITNVVNAAIEVTYIPNPSHNPKRLNVGVFGLAHAPHDEHDGGAAQKAHGGGVTGGHSFPN